ncbi:PEP-CTERM sorting domain-containing protein [Alteromonas stellipolaris]|uniref:exosortase-dependent surface protein XDP1 n=1 Tax=Alteromonas stellipolaris TaxID=233316 RepID=UPI002117AE35|nr:exosortase-dependent surface protein XDP1 [Alteromonas stellipolaris]MCQ8849542.1 PEP-CTERM sorting domain-containing protein [Alteromonas stellipolaris]
MRSLFKKVVLPSLLLFSSTTAIFVAGNAQATYHNNHNYSYCGSGSSNSSSNQNSSCNSALGEHTYDLVEDGVYQSTNANDSNISIDGVSISLAAFSDTQGVYNETVVGADLEKISNQWAYGVTNNDEAIYSGNSDHAIDNLNYNYQGSNAAYRSGTTNVERDYDFVLLSFDQAVTLTGASFSWLYDSNDSQISVAALGNTSTLTSGVNTWSDIVADALTSASFDIENCETLDHRADFTFTESSQYWLVGAYNTVFGNIGGYVGNDAFKLANIGFSKTETQAPPAPTEVTEPGTLGLLIACSLFVMWRRKKSI